MSTIAVTQTTLDGYNYGGSTATIRIYSDQTFITSDSDTIVEGTHRIPGSFYKNLSCTVASNVLTIPEFTIDSTSDSNNQRATYTFMLFDADGHKRDTLIAPARIPHTLGSTISWEQIIIYSSAVHRPYSTYYSSEQINALILAQYANTQPLDPDLTAIAALNTSADQMIYTTGAQAWALTGITSFSRSLLDDSTAAIARATLVAQETLVSGTNIKTVNGQTLLGSGDLDVDALTNETVVYRDAYASNALALTAAEGKELGITSSTTVSATTEVSRQTKVSLRGDGIFDVALGQTLTIQNPLVENGRKWNKGKGKMVLRNGTVPLSAWTGAIGGTTYVTEDVDSSETAISVADASVFGNAPFAIAIDSEVMWCTAINTSTDVLTVERGFDGSTAVMHHPTTTLNGGIDADDTSITVVAGTAMAYAPFYAMIDTELVKVSDISGNTWTIVRAQGGTSAASHSNGATLTKRPEVFPCITTVMRDGILESIADGGVLRGTPGIWATTGGWDLPSISMMIGTGSQIDGISGCVFRMITDSSYVLKIGSNRYGVYVTDWGIDCRNAPHSTNVRCSGTQAGGATQNCKFVNCRFTAGMYGLNVYDEINARSWQCTSMLFDHCWFISHSVADFRCNSINTNFQFNSCTFTPLVAVETTLAEPVDSSETAIDVTDASVFGVAPFYVMVDFEQMYVTSVTGNTLNLGTEPGGVATGRAANSTYETSHLTGAAVYRPTVCFRGDYHGPTLFNSCTFNGANIAPQNIHPTIDSINTTTNLITCLIPHGIPPGEISAGYIRGLQSMSITVGVTSVTAGTARCVVTATGMTNSPKNVDFSVANSDTASQVATKARAALDADVDVSAWLADGGSGAEITLTRTAFPIPGPAPTVTEGTAPDGFMNFTIQNVTSTGITQDLTATDITDDRCPNANRHANDAVAIELGKQRIWLKGVGLTTCYAYLNPRHAFYPDEDDYRVDFTDTGTGLLQLCTNMPYRSGRPFAVAHVSNTNAGLQFSSCQDEGFPYWLVVDRTFEKMKWIKINDCLVQSQIHLRARCRVDLTANWMYANSVTDLSAEGNPAAADVYLNNNSITYNNVVGGYHDMGNVLVTNNRSIDAFCGDSTAFNDDSPDLSLNHSKAPFLASVGFQFTDTTSPAAEFTRDRSQYKLPIARFGLKNAWERQSEEQWHDVSIIDEITTPAFSYMEDWLEIGLNPNSPYYTYLKDGRYLSGHLAYRGRLINTNSTLFSATTGTISHNFALGEVHYFNTALTGDVVLHVSNTAGEEVATFERKYIFIPTDTTNRLVSFGDRFYARGTKAFNTGSVAGYWVITCYAFGGNQLLVAGREFITADGTGPDNIWRSNASTSVTLKSGDWYFSVSGTLVTFTLPTSSRIGDSIRILGTGAGGWKIAQAASQYILWSLGTETAGTDRTTTGTGGSLSSSDGRDYIELVCTEANLGWTAAASKGNFTLV